MSSSLEVARSAWGTDLPDWVETLAIECDRSSQNKVSKQLKRSASAVSQVLNRKYGADLSEMEGRVRGVFQEQTVACPSMGAMPTQVCQDWRVKSRTFLLGDPQRVRMFRACLKCPRNKKDAAQ